MQLPTEDKHNVTKDYLETQMAILMGGRVAEEIYLKQMSTGAGSDIERASALARAMVCEYGMSDLGPMTFGKKEEQVFLGREIGQARDFSDDTAKAIDLQVRNFIDAGYKSAYDLLAANPEIMHKLSAALLERETLDAIEIKLIIDGKDLPPFDAGFRGSDEDLQKVLKPEGRTTGFEGAPSHA